MSTFVVGFALFYFTAFQGMGSKILQLQGVLEFTKDSDVVPILMKTYLPPFVLGVVFLGAIAAIHSTAAPVYRHRRHHPAARRLLALHP